MEITGDLKRAVLVRGGGVGGRKSKQSRLGRKGEAIKWKQWVHITLKNFGINRTKSSNQRLNWSKGRVHLIVDWSKQTKFICWLKWYPKEGETECRRQRQLKGKMPDLTKVTDIGCRFQEDLIDLKTNDKYTLITKVKTVRIYMQGSLVDLMIGNEDFSFAAAAAKLLQSCLTLCDPTDSSPPGSPIPGILHARTLEWVAISFSNAWK